MLIQEFLYNTWLGNYYDRIRNHDYCNDDSNITISIWSHLLDFQIWWSQLHSADLALLFVEILLGFIWLGFFFWWKHLHFGDLWNNYNCFRDITLPFLAEEVRHQFNGSSHSFTLLFFRSQMCIDFHHVEYG